MIVGTLIEAGKGRLSAEDVEKILNEKDKHACRYKADAGGLYLVNVWYGEGEDEK